jgi:hypothetical protein
MSHLHEPRAEEQNFEHESQTEWERRRDETPEILDDTADTVLAYKPKPKTKAAKRRARRKKRNQ